VVVVKVRKNRSDHGSSITRTSFAQWFSTTHRPQWRAQQSLAHFAPDTFLKGMLRFWEKSKINANYPSPRTQGSFA
jgi:hypothetical protein